MWSHAKISSLTLSSVCPSDLLSVLQLDLGWNPQLSTGFGGAFAMSAGGLG